MLVLERHDAFGGAATVYRHNGLAIEASLHEIDGLDEQDPKIGLLRSLGLGRDLQFVDVGDLYEVRGGPLARHSYCRTGQLPRSPLPWPVSAAQIRLRNT